MSYALAEKPVVSPFFDFRDRQIATRPQSGEPSAGGRRMHPETVVGCQLAC